MNHQKNIKKRIRDTFVYSVLTLAVSAITVGTLYTAFQQKPKEEAPPKTIIQESSHKDSRSAVTEKENVCPEGAPLHDVISDVQIPEIPEADNQVTLQLETEFAEVPTEETANGIADDTFIKPVSGYISRPFSIELPVYSPTMYDYRTHGGVDIVGEIGQTVSATANGDVTAIRDDYLLGKTVEITHTNGLVSVYANLQNDLPSDIVVGAHVRCGQTVGGIGQTAKSESLDTPHVHFEIKKDEMCINPNDCISW